MASTRQTIANFFQNAVQREFSRDILFRIININFDGGASLTEDDMIYARSAELPGRDIVNVAAPYMGLQFNIPGVVQYPGSENYSVEFYVDAESSIREIFEQESRRVFDEATSTGEYGTPNANSTITLVQLDKALDPITEYKLIGASIRNVGPISYQMAEGTGQIALFTVGMSYHFFEKPL